MPPPGAKKAKKLKKKATISGSPHGGGGYSQPKPKPKPKPTQASLPPSMGFNPPNIDPGFQQALKTYTPPVQPVNPNLGNTIQNYTNQGITNQNQLAAQSMLDAGITNLSGYTGGQFGGQAAAGQQAAGVTPLNVLAQTMPPPDDEEDKDDTTVDPKDDEKLTEEEKKEKEKKEQAYKTAQDLTKWWADPKNQKGQGRYKERKNIFTGKLSGSQEAVTLKLQDKLNKGYYKIVQGPKGEPLIIHASTGTPVNPYTGNIISTQTSQDQGGAYQNEMARITGIAPENAGVFSKEYQTGNGLSVGEMKPEHALRFLMKKNKGAFEQFFSMNKDKAGFNPFSASAISTAMGAVLNMITGPEALQVGNNLERAGWGKAIKGEDGKYTIQLSKTGAEKWSNSFNFDTVNIGGKVSSGFTSPEAIAKDKSKGFLSEILGTKKFPDQPVDLTNLMSQGVDGEGGYFQGSDLVSGQTGQPFDPNTFDPMNPKGANLATLDSNLTPNVKFQPQYGYMPPITPSMDVIGTPSSFTNVGGSTTNYPAFTSEGYKIGAYNPSKDYSSQGGGGGGNQGGGGGGGQDQDQDTTTPPPGPLTFDVYGRPVTYDYSGGPEQIYLGGGYKRDGQYIGSPYGYSKGGIANFRPYGY